MPTLSARDLKSGGIAAIEQALDGQDDAVISVQGTERFVVMDMNRYQHLRVCELDAALAQCQAEIEAEAAAALRALAADQAADPAAQPAAPKATPAPAPAALAPSDGVVIHPWGLRARSLRRKH